MPRHDDVASLRRRRMRLHFFLTGGSLVCLAGGGLALALLARLLLGVVPAVEAAGGGAEHAVVAGIVTGDAADRRPFQAALGVGGRRRNRHERGSGEQQSGNFHDGVLLRSGRSLNRAAPLRFPGPGGVESAREGAACIHARADLLEWCGAELSQPGAREIVMAKGQMRSNKEKKKPKADKNLKKGGAAPSPFSSGKTPAGQSPNSRKS